MEFFTKFIDNQQRDMDKLREKLWSQHALIEGLENKQQRCLTEIDNLKQKVSTMKGILSKIKWQQFL